MKIAVGYENGKVYGHFGDTPKFKIYDVEGKDIRSSVIITADPEGHTHLCDQLHGLGVNRLICGAYGDRMLQLMKSYGIEVYGNVEGEADEAVKALLNGTLRYSEEAHHCTCNH